MKWLTVLATLMSISLAPSVPARADDKVPANKSVEGSWEGRVIVTPQIALKLTLDVVKAKDGSLSGTWGSPDQGAKELALQSIAYTDGVLTFSAKNAGATYKGKLNEHGTEVIGEWVQGGKTFVLNFKRVDPSKVVVTPVPKELLGIWDGKLKLNGGIDLRVALKVEQGKDGALKATLASPDQGANDIPISSIGLKDNVLRFESKIIGAKFTGKRNEQGTAFEGEFNQHGASLPLKLMKTDKITEPARPQTPRPPFPYRAEDVIYENKAGQVTLAGTLTLPSGAGPFPAVILITGSGVPCRIAMRALSATSLFLVLCRLSQPARGLQVLRGRATARASAGSTRFRQERRQAKTSRAMCLRDSTSSRGARKSTPASWA